MCMTNCDGGLTSGGRSVKVRMEQDGMPQLEETNMGFLEFNWHAGEERKTTVIEIVTEKCFLDRLQSIEKKDTDIHEKMGTFRQQL